MLFRRSTPWALCAAHGALRQHPTVVALRKDELYYTCITRECTPGIGRGPGRRPQKRPNPYFFSGFLKFWPHYGVQRHPGARGDVLTKYQGVLLLPDPSRPRFCLFPAVFRVPVVSKSKQRSLDPANMECGTSKVAGPGLIPA